MLCVICHNKKSVGHAAPASPAQVQPRASGWPGTARARLGPLAASPGDKGSTGHRGPRATAGGQGVWWAGGASPTQPPTIQGHHLPSEPQGPGEQGPEAPDSLSPEGGTTAMPHPPWAGQQPFLRPGQQGQGLGPPSLPATDSGSCVYGASGRGSLTSWHPLTQPAALGGAAGGGPRGLGGGGRAGSVPQQPREQHGLERPWSSARGGASGPSVPAVAPVSVRFV